jgi:zinc/manganese transport system substrate-binding protein
MIKPFVLMLLLLCTNMPAYAVLKVFSCEPEWASLVQELGSEHVKTYAATSALQDPHHIQARPSLIAKMRKADLVVCTGAELEIGWLPVLLRRAANPRVQPGNPGYFEAADYVNLLDVPEKLDRGEGDIHPHGDPHIQTDPRNILLVAKHLAVRLAQLDPDHAREYETNSAEFLARWQAAIAGWEQRGSKLAGTPIVTQHKSWTYLIHWLQLSEIVRLEAKPGVPPSTAHLTAVLQKVEQTPAQGILRAAYQSPKASDWLHDRTGIAVIVLPYTVGGNKQATDLFSLFDSTLRLLEGMKNG